MTLTGAVPSTGPSAGTSTTRSSAPSASAPGRGGDDFGATLRSRALRQDPGARVGTSQASRRDATARPAREDRSPRPEADDRTGGTEGRGRTDPSDRAGAERPVREATGRARRPGADRDGQLTDAADGQSTPATDAATSAAVTTAVSAAVTTATTTATPATAAAGSSPAGGPAAGAAATAAAGTTSVDSRAPGTARAGTTAPATGASGAAASAAAASGTPAATTPAATTPAVTTPAAVGSGQPTTGDAPAAAPGADPTTGATPAAGGAPQAAVVGAPGAAAGPTRPGALPDGPPRTGDAPLLAAPVPAPASAPVQQTGTLGAPAPVPGAAPSFVPPQSQVLSAVTPLLRGPDGTQTLTLHLHPQDLGSVRVQISLAGSEVSLHLAASDQGTREMLRQGLGDLRHQLEEMGLGTAGVDVGAGAPDDGSRDPRAGTAGAGGDPRPGTPGRGVGATSGTREPVPPHVRSHLRPVSTPTDAGLDVRM